MRGVRRILFLFLAGSAIARADQIEDLVRIHREAMGGGQLQACRAIEARGTVIAGRQELKFEMVAARPNRVRLTLRSENRTLIQAMDGVEPAWLADSVKKEARPMNDADAREFAVDAEFDDPLVGGAARGFTLDFAGETLWESRRVLKVLVTRRDTAPSFLLLDPDTYFILARLTKRKEPSGRETTIETRYEDFRPVSGVIFAHRILVLVEGKRLRETVLTEIHAIAEPPPEIFVRPVLVYGELATPAGL